MNNVNVCGFLYRDKKLFIARRSEKESFMPGLWELVGGGVEEGESLEKALVREFKEELDLDIIVEKQYHSWKYLCKENGKIENEVEYDFLVRLSDMNQVETINPEFHSECGWVTEAEALVLFNQNHPANQLEAVKKGFLSLRSL